MEEGDNNTPTTPTGDQVVAGSSSSSSNSRWNPTKEQINMLENLYKQGVRTPSAEQIQQITSRLRAFGHIEGKNVFYWFQNHKARQRQKQKQESLASFNRFIHSINYPPPAVVHAPPPHDRVFLPYCHPAPSHNGAYYDLTQQNEMGLYGQQSQLQQHNVVSPRSTCNNVTRSQSSSFANYGAYDNNNVPMHTTVDTSHYETLSLFPTHPTGILRGRSTNDDNNSSTTSTPTNNNHDIDNDRDRLSGVAETGYIDFFSTTAQNGSFVTD